MGYRRTVRYPRHDRRRMLERVGIVLQETAVEQFLTVREVLRRRASYCPIRAIPTP